MKAMILGIGAMIVIAIGANLALDEIGFSQADVSASPNVRLGD
ncbi:hypothetical protein [Puniceibacterium sp. IMCC21224]|nr:hypothetical protein [Puniceibacterium sp. IMCC21224]KMK65745.1 hypothetical protein IMCC21224_11580 [Puniceibacterium sp. IMCC21224]